MRNKISLSILGILVLGGLVALSGFAGTFSPAPARAASDGELPTITVSGSGSVSLTPDIANISIGVQTEDKEAAKAVTTNNAKAQDVLTKLKSFGIPEKDINTTNFSVYPRQSFDDQGKPVETTYVVENTVMVKVRDLTKIGEILDTVVKSGANTISNISFDVADSTEAYNKAMEAAIDDARAKADIAAEAAGVKVGQVHSIQASGSTPYSAAKRASGLEMLAAAPQVPISAGQMEMTVDVTVVYLIGG